MRPPTRKSKCFSLLCKNTDSTIGKFHNRISSQLFWFVSYHCLYLPMTCVSRPPPLSLIFFLNLSAGLHLSPQEFNHTLSLPLLVPLFHLLLTFPSLCSILIIPLISLGPEHRWCGNPLGVAPFILLLFHCSPCRSIHSHDGPFLPEEEDRLLCYSDLHALLHDCHSVPSLILAQPWICPCQDCLRLVHPSSGHPLMEAATLRNVSLATNGNKSRESKKF